MLVSVWINVEPNCECQEGRLLHFNDLAQPTGGWSAAPRLHNCQYIRQRNSLIPLAESLADGSGKRWGTPEWSAAFYIAMDSLGVKARAAGLL